MPFDRCEACQNEFKLVRQATCLVREVFVKLAAQGYMNERGKPYGAQSIKMMLEA